MRSPLVYLAGQISGLTFEQAIGWREEVQKELSKYGIDCASPMRAKNHLSGKGPIPANFVSDKAVSTGKAITTRDRWDCTRADVVLMNLLGVDKVSIGSMIEIGWCDLSRTPLVLVMEDNGLHEHMMVNELAGYRAKSLEEGVEIVKAILLI